MRKFSYKTSVDYSVADPAKVLAQKEGRKTAKNLPYSFREVPGTRGESAYVFDMGSMYGALVQEGLGTKSLVAQAVYAETGKSYFAAIAKDTVATFVNDLVSVGATPVVSNAYWSSSSYEWLADRQLTQDLIRGWRAACDQAGIAWGGGETQALNGVVVDGVLELAGSAFGVIKAKDQLVSESKLRAGDAIILVESNGVHANGISLIRDLADTLPGGYQTKLADGQTLGEAVLAPSHIYAKLVGSLQAADIDIHYLSNITGHGWRKIMRATRDFTYEIDFVPPPQEIFNFISEHTGNSEAEMYGNYNMGAGYAVFVPAAQARDVVKIARRGGLKAWAAGSVKRGKKKVVINPKSIVFGGESLGVR